MKQRHESRTAQGVGADLRRMIEPHDRREGAIEKIYREWDDAVARSDVDALLALYAPDGVIESPLIPHLLGKERGICTGRVEMRQLFEIFRERKPHLRRNFNTGYFSDGKTVIWEYPRTTNQGEQMDIVESMDINENGLIQHHRVYWGWFGVGVLNRDEYRKSNRK